MPEEWVKYCGQVMKISTYTFLSHTSVLLMFLKACINRVIKQNKKHKRDKLSGYLNMLYI